MKNIIQEEQPALQKDARRPYVRPELKRVDLALAETLSSGCKLATDIICVGPPITAYNAGS